MMTMEHFDVLGQLFGCYFHQDWPSEFESDVEALRAIATTEPREQVVAGLDEVEKLLSIHRSETELREIMIDEVGCYFEPQSVGMSYREWLGRVREVFSHS